MSGMLSGRHAVVPVIVCGLVQGLVVFSLTFHFFVNSHLDHSRAWIPAYSLTAALAAPLLSLQSFYNYARGHCEAARRLIPAYSLTAALAAPLLSLQSFYNYARGHCEAAPRFFRAMHSVHLISVEQ